MADSKFERFKKMYPGGTKDMNIIAIPSPLPGPGGIGRALIGKGVQSGVRRFGDVTKGDKTTQMKTRQGLERRDPMEPRVVPSGRSKELEKVREGGGGPTKMKDRRGLEIKKTERKAEAPPSRGFGKKVAKAGAATGANDRVESTQSVQRSSYNQKNPTQRPYDASTSPKAAPRPKARPADLKPKKAEKRKPERKSKVRIAFEKEFSAARKAGKKKFRSKLGKYGTYSTKLK